jgi:hypothetical protein
MKIKTKGGLNTGQILASTIWDLRRDCTQMEDKDVAYDLGYIMGLCNSLGRTRLSDLVLNRFEPYAF